MLQIMATASINPMVSKMPGIMEPRNKTLIDCPVWSPIIMSTTLGGIITPSVAPVATTPALKPRS